MICPSLCLKDLQVTFEDEAAHRVGMVAPVGPVGVLEVIAFSE